MLSIKIDSLSKLQTTLLRFRTEAATRVEAELDTTALLIETTAKELAPVDTGRLRSSIHVEKPARFTRSVETNVEYAPFLELGTRYQRAQPFLFPAYEQHRQRFLTNLQQALKFQF
jgi:HK97 gp10 family phage protein